MNRYLTPAAVVVVGVASHALNSAKAIVVEAYIRTFGLSPALAGYLLTVEMTAATVGTVLAASFPQSLGGRSSLRLAMGISLIANIASVLLSTNAHLYLFPLRTLCGLGTGFGLGRLAIAIAFDPKPDRLSGIYSVASASFASLIALVVIPAQSAIGQGAIFVLLATPLPVALVLTSQFPVRTATAATSEASWCAMRKGKFTIFVGLFLYYLALGAYWPFVGVIGGLSAVPHAAVATILVWAGVASIVASFLAVMCGDRDVSGPLFNGLIVLGVASVALPMIFPSPLLYMMSVCAFIFSWFALFPFLLGFMSRLDPSGRMNGFLYVIAAVCFAGGPAIAGWLIGNAPSTLIGAQHLQWLTLVSFVGGAALLMRIHAGRGVAQSGPQ